MSTPIENIVANVNAQTQRDTLQSIGAQQSARRQVADKESAINAIVDSADQTAKENFFNGIQGDGQAEDLLSSKDSLIDKISEDVEVIEILNKSESAIRKMLCRREGRDPANFADLNAVAADQGLMEDIGVRQESLRLAARAQKAMTAIDQTDFAVRAIMCGTTGEVPSSFSSADDVSQDAGAMSTIAGNQATMEAVAASQTAMQEVAASQTALDEAVASQTAMQEVAASQTAMQEVIASQTALDAVVASQTAMDVVSASQTAMQKVAASQTALDTIADSQTATSSIAASSTAVGAIEGASSSGRNSIPITNDASIYVAELTGGGGGGGDGFGGNSGSGSSGGDTSFHQSVAEGGGGGGEFGGNGSNGDAIVSSPDVAINTGGTQNGGDGISGGGDGGDGAFVKALIVNPNRQSLSLTVGSAGDPGSSEEIDLFGSNGVAFINTPNVYQ